MEDAMAAQTNDYNYDIDIRIRRDVAIYFAYRFFINIISYSLKRFPGWGSNVLNVFIVKGVPWMAWNSFASNVLYEFELIWVRLRREIRWCYT